MHLCLVLLQSLSFHLSGARWRSYFRLIECAEGQRSPCALMLERDMNEQGAFHQGRGNKEMKRKHVSNSLLLLPLPASWRLFTPLQHLRDCNKELRKIPFSHFRLQNYSKNPGGKKNVFYSGKCLCSFQKNSFSLKTGDNDWPGVHYWEITRRRPGSGRNTVPFQSKSITTHECDMSDTALARIITCKVPANIKGHYKNDGNVQTRKSNMFVRGLSCCARLSFTSLLRLKTGFRSAGADAS